MKRLFLTMLLMGAVMMTRAEELRTVWLDELGVSPCYIQDWGTMQINRSIAGTPLTVQGKVYERGIGTHAISRMLFEVGGEAVTISGWAGADDKNLFAQKLQFKIFGDRKELWSSGVLRRGDAAQRFDVDLTGVEKLYLLVEECGDGIMYDHADWLEVKVLTRGEVKPIPVWPQPIQRAKYILTPPAPECPQINNPQVYGARPGNPFLMPVMASGRRPMTFAAEGLPQGLKLDKRSGIISGVTTAEGDFRIRLRAKNALGEAVHEMTLKLGREIALTPPMGWNSWNCFRFEANDEKVRAAARLMREKLQPYGWTYINIDDGWMATERNADGVLLPNANFTDFKMLADYIHSLGLKFGLYSSPGAVTCGDFPGSYQHEEIDARTWEKWGIDYVKYDYCGYSQIERDSEEKTIQEPYIVMRKALDNIRRDLVYCVGYGAPNVWRWGAEAGGNQWRTTRDITDEWNVVMAIGTFQDVCAEATAPGRYNDPDMLVVGYVGRAWSPASHDSALTPDEQYAHISLWSILSAPMLIGCDMSRMDDFTLSLLTNTEVIAVNQDPLVAPAMKRLVRNGQIWYKRLYDGSYALGFFQMDPYFVMWDQSDAEAMQERMYDFNFDLSSLGLGDKVTVRDLWRQQDLGTFSGNYRALVPYHGVQLLRISAAK